MKSRNTGYNIVLILLIIGVVFTWFIYTSPRYSLYKTKKAIENHDYSTFTKYINLDSVINNVMNKAVVNKLDSTDTLENLEIELVRSIIYGLRAQVILIVKNQFEKGIEKGRFDYLFYNRDSRIKNQESKLNLWEQIRKIRINDIDYVKKSKDIVVIGINCNTDTKDKKFVFRIRMRKTGIHWQIVELVDFMNLRRLLS